MTAVTTESVRVAESSRRARPHEILRIVRLHTVNPAIFFGVPWLILAGAWAVTMVIALIIQAAAGPLDQAETGFEYSWAVLSPQWYLIVVGVQAVSYTFPFALGFGATRRDYWLGTGLMFVIVSVVNAAAIATLLLVERATNGWGIGAGMFDALWYVGADWGTAFYTTFALQLLVLFIGAGITTVYMRWRMRGMMTVLFGGVALILAIIAFLTFTETWEPLGTWLASIGVVGVFTLVLAKALLWAVAGLLVIRRATPR
ncbi:hypothetical protein GCM10017608_35060 [Agromyces luteolus]|uniref:Uncharacterized protein n=1 Tax=Agromyces luteolus TaxID=88373 RepID=A0A7C9LHC7_9MICO|nr:hypothetical protein [Agromyces luteolus]MUN07555.1 hypothetical protein [Agromyces luteolus]GLK29568.1 hypothetical protein GCM10017608_35060 [Agromyces luteolus]